MNSEVERFLSTFDGNQTAAARLLGVAQPTVSEWLRGNRPVPHGTAADMERLSKGEVHADVVRPDARWERRKDKAWPWHPQGRPFLEVARADAA